MLIKYSIYERKHEINKNTYIFMDHSTVHPPEANKYPERKCSLDNNTLFAITILTPSKSTIPHTTSTAIFLYPLLSKLPCARLTVYIIGTPLKEYASTIKLEAFHVW